jgi:signal transduction histidine kinase
VTAKKRTTASSIGSGAPLQDVVDRLQGEAAGLRRSRRRLVEAADADRRAIERTLHDRVLQNLVALAVDVRRLAGLVEAQPAAAKALLGDMAANVREALAETTALAQKIYPPLLEERGFATSLRSAAESAGITVLVDVPSGADYPTEISPAVYWSCVEALLSSSPGSQATVTVLVEDGGLAFDVVVAGRHSAARLDRLRDRIEALDGRFSVDEGQGLDSRIHGWLPLSR